MNNRRNLAIALGAGALLAPFGSFAQQQDKIWRIGYLSNSSMIEPRDEAFRQRLRELGYVDGKNAVIEWRFSQGEVGRNPALAAELVRLKVDCIVGAGVTPIRSAKQATGTIPIVMATIDADPVEQGFVASLARPGGNITGFTAIAYELAANRLELLKEATPKATRAAILIDPAAREAGQAHLTGTEFAARKLGMQVQVCWRHAVRRSWTAHLAAHGLGAPRYSAWWRSDGQTAIGKESLNSLPTTGCRPSTRPRNMCPLEA